MIDPGDDADEDDSLPLRELNRLAGGSCAECRTAYAAREAVFSVALGFKAAPRCLPCLAVRLGREAGELREQLVGYVHRRDCYLKAWRVAVQMDGAIGDAILAIGGGERAQGLQSSMAHPPGSSETVDSPDVAEVWDAGDMGCGELVMALRLRMKNLPAGGVIKVTATDPAAPEDIPAWCRLTGHTLIVADLPHYLIRRKKD